MVKYKKPGKKLDIIINWTKFDKIGDILYIFTDLCNVTYGVWNVTDGVSCRFIYIQY